MDTMDRMDKNGLLNGRWTMGRDYVAPYMLFAFPQFPPQREWDSNSSELCGKKLRNANWKGGLGENQCQFAICRKRFTVVLISCGSQP